MAAMTDEQARLFLETNFGHVATLRPDGSPNVSVVWVDWDGENVVFNTAWPRAKPRRLARDARLSIEVCDRADPYRYIAVDGRGQLTEEGAVEHIERLSQKYLGRPFTHRTADTRVIVRVRPELVYAYGFAS